MKQLCACCRMGWELERPELPTHWFELRLTGCELDAGAEQCRETHIATVAICPHCTVRLLGRGPERGQQAAQAGLREAILNSMRAGEWEIENSKLKIEVPNPMTADGHPHWPPHNVEGSPEPAHG